VSHPASLLSQQLTIAKGWGISRHELKGNLLTIYQLPRSGILGSPLNALFER
jgi:hypothetical protein